MPPLMAKRQDGPDVGASRPPNSDRHRQRDQRAHRAKHTTGDRHSHGPDSSRLPAGDSPIPPSGGRTPHHASSPSSAREDIKRQLQHLARSSPVTVAGYFP